MAKTQNITPFKSTKTVSREEEIEAAVESINDLSLEEIGDLYIKLNRAAAEKGFVFTKPEADAIKLMSQKTIPDVPKKIELNAHVRTESVILQYLEINDRAKENNYQNIDEHIEHEQAINARVIPALVEEFGIPE